mgnify:CR=1 FL=1
MGVVKMNQLRTDPPDAQSCEYLTRVEASMEHPAVVDHIELDHALTVPILPGGDPQEDLLFLLVHRGVEG